MSSPPEKRAAKRTEANAAKRDAAIAAIDDFLARLHGGDDAEAELAEHLRNRLTETERAAFLRGLDDGDWSHVGALISSGSGSPQFLELAGEAVSNRWCCGPSPISAEQREHARIFNAYLAIVAILKVTTDWTDTVCQAQAKNVLADFVAINVREDYRGNAEIERQRIIADAKDTFRDPHRGGPWMFRMRVEDDPLSHIESSRTPLR